jgi:hypothetical protein
MSRESLHNSLYKLSLLVRLTAVRPSGSHFLARADIPTQQNWHVGKASLFYVPVDSQQQFLSTPTPLPTGQ